MTASIAQSPASEPISSEPPKVMIVEDETIISFGIQTCLANSGFAVTAAPRSAAEAFRQIEQERPHVVLMDIHIPGDTDGVEAAGIIRNRYDLPVIYLTAHADQATLARAQSTEPFGFIVKPFEPTTMKAVITMALRKHRMESELRNSRRQLSSALQELEHAKWAAETANRHKSDFLARMSHEIRTPMNLIMGMNALLLESPLSTRQKQQVEISYRNVRRLLWVINSILDVTKLEVGNLALESVPFDLDEVLKECAATVASAIERKGLHFEVSLYPDSWRYWMGDPERLQQVLLNLIGNSIKFTAKGRVDLRVRPAEGPQGEPGLRFEVSDTGCGIPPGKAELIFDAFQQAEGSISRPYEGTGLGLAIAKSLIELMVGRIWVEPKPDPGSLFVFTAFFPAADEQAIRDKNAGTATNVEQVKAGTRLLVVEDNPENLVLIEAYLENLSIKLDSAANGVEAVEKRQRGTYDLILMDIQMPVMDGYTATREIRAWEKVRGIPPVPIVALSAHASSEAFAESKAAGCNAHLTKPLERVDLIGAVGKFAERPADPPQVPPEPVSPLIEARRPAFLANRRLDLEKMRDALGAGNFELIRSIGHNCKGTGTGYGFPEISKIGFSIETAAKAADAASLNEALRHFELSLHAAVIRTDSNFIQSTPSPSDK